MQRRCSGSCRTRPGSCRGDCRAVGRCGTKKHSMFCDGVFTPGRRAAGATAESCEDKQRRRRLVRASPRLSLLVPARRESAVLVRPRAGRARAAPGPTPRASRARGSPSGSPAARAPSMDGCRASARSRRDAARAITLRATELPSGSGVVARGADQKHLHHPERRTIASVCVVVQLVRRRKSAASSRAPRCLDAASGRPRARRASAGASQARMRPRVVADRAESATPRGRRAASSPGGCRRRRTSRARRPCAGPEQLPVYGPGPSSKVSATAFAVPPPQ